MKKFTFSSLVILFAFAMVATTFTACGDSEPETVMGCTDADADNQNVDANSDDGSCTYFTRFAGIYDGTFACMALPFTSVELTISQSAGTTDGLSMLATSTALPFPIPLTSTIKDKNTQVVSQLIEDVDLSALLPDPPYPASLRWDIQIDGELVRQDDGSHTGDLTFVLTEVTDPSITLTDVCGFTAVPQ